jgi:hypothetical protein
LNDAIFMGGTHCTGGLYPTQGVNMLQNVDISNLQNFIGWS